MMQKVHVKQFWTQEKKCLQNMVLTEHELT